MKNTRGVYGGGVPVKRKAVHGGRSAVFSAVFAGILALAGIPVITGCVALAEAGGRIADGSAFAEKTTALYEGEKIRLRKTLRGNGERSLLITMEKYPAAVFRASDPGEGGSFYFTALEYLGGSYSGWNEFTLELSGAGRFMTDNGGGGLFLEGPLEPVRISAGRIRRDETRITGAQALTALMNRRERIAALARWMREEAAARKIPLSFPDGAAFERYWKRLLLPELVPKKQRPAVWKAEGAEWTWKEDVRWNTSYTALLFPEELGVLRDSGALLRDWEEAVEWIRIEYEWDDIVRRLKGGIIMKRIK
ncbi:MAG: hypothetical protein LBG42_04495 [Treponema sp.]|jgi:hypothetical protein|nr:hypothetical protein [Treponema sp.]